MTPAFAEFSPIAESGIKVALTTGMTTDRKIFDFCPQHGIIAKTEYPGVAQLVGRDIWDVEVGCSSHLTRTTRTRGRSISLHVEQDGTSLRITGVSRLFYVHLLLCMVRPLV